MNALALGLLLLVMLLILAATSSGHGKPACENDPMFYLRGTAYDCHALDKAETSKGTQP